jgi:lysophospholipase L1-like esterase
LIDTARLRTPEQVDRVAAARSMYLTLDGVHLNSRGTRLAADAFAGAIGQIG